MNWNKTIAALRADAEERNHLAQSVAKGTEVRQSHAIIGGVLASLAYALSVGQDEPQPTSVRNNGLPEPFSRLSDDAVSVAKALFLMMSESGRFIVGPKTRMTSRMKAAMDELFNHSPRLVDFEVHAGGVHIYRPSVDMRPLRNWVIPKTSSFEYVEPVDQAAPPLPKQWSPLEMSVLLHHFYSPEPWPQTDTLAYKRAIVRLTKYDLLKPETPGFPPAATDKGRKLIEAWCHTPIPEDEQTA